MTRDERNPRDTEEARVVTPAPTEAEPRLVDTLPSTIGLSERAGTLIEALPYLQQFRGAVVVVKYGGAAMIDPALSEAWARDVVLLEHVGLRPVVVHGGGPALSRTMRRMGIEPSFVDGHRVTSADSAEIAEMVLSGSINKEVVSCINRAGGRAIGLSGTDARMMRVRRHRPGGVDIGFVGQIEAIDPTPIEVLLEAGYVSVLSSTATDTDGQTYNINADLVAGAVAAAMRAAKLVFLSDVPGVVLDGALVPTLSASAARALLAEQRVTGGMRPKLEAAIAAIEGGVPRVHLVDGRLPHALLLEIFTDRGVGTLVVPDDARVAEVGTRAPTTAAPRAPWAGTLATRGAAAVMSSYGPRALELASGHGSRVQDSDGREYLDFTSGIAVSALGHAHPAVVEAIHSAADGLLHVSNLYWTEPMVRLAERLTRASGMERAFFCNSGAEAIEAAIKLARKARPGRESIVCFERSFHGRTLGALSITAQPHYQASFRPLLPGVVTLPFGDRDAAARAIDSSTAAVIVEAIQGEGGVRPAPEGWLAHLRARCDAAGALLVFDEVQTGIGRTGTFFAYQDEGVIPDAVAAAKALAGGLPMGALLARGEAASAFAPGDHASTFGGGPFIANVANAVLDVVLADGFLDAVRAKGARLGGELAALAARHPLALEARGRGLIWGLALREPCAGDVVAALRERGVLATIAGKEVVRFTPPLIVTDKEIDEMLTCLEEALDTVCALREPALHGSGPSGAAASESPLATRAASTAGERSR
jgi:acetylornithine/N-succinyldiaminopimelate aminotransferase